MNKFIGNFMVFSALLVLIVVRIVCGEKDVLVSLVNFGGMIIAFVGTINEMKQSVKKPYRKYFVIPMIITLTMACIVIVTVLCGIVVFSNLVNDLITLLALIFSVPCTLYCRITEKLSDRLLE